MDKHKVAHAGCVGSGEVLNESTFKSVSDNAERGHVSFSLRFQGLGWNHPCDAASHLGCAGIKMEGN